MDDLWPKDIGTPMTKPTVPFAILQEQGKLLGEKTKNIVVGRVAKTEFIHSRLKPIFAFNFLIESTALGYTYRLFTISYPSSLYPVRFMELDEDIQQELSLKPNNLPAPDSEEEFELWLKKIFNTQKLKGVISAILAQSSEVPS